MRKSHTLPIFVLLIGLLIGVLGGCGSGNDDAPKTESEKRKALDDSAFGELSGTLDKAAEVEELTKDRKRQLDETLDE